SNHESTSFKRDGRKSCRNRQIESWFNSPEIGHQRWQSEFRGPKEYRHKNGGKGAGESHSRSQTEACKSHPRRRNSERNQWGIVAPPLRVDIMQEISREKTRQKRGRCADQRKQSQGQHKIMHLAAELAVALGDEHARFESKSFAETVDEEGHVGRCSSDHKCIRQCRTAENCFTCMQGDERTARHEARALRERWCFDGARRRVAQVKFPDDTYHGQVQIFAVCLADRKSLAKINTKRSGRCVIQYRNHAVVRAKKSASYQRKTTHVSFRDRVNSEDVDV